MSARSRLRPADAVSTSPEEDLDREEEEEDLDRDEEDPALDLPPLDQEEEPAAPDDDLADMLDPLEDDDGDPFDDRVARDLDVDLEADLDDVEAPGEEEEAAAGVDVGALDEGLALDDAGGWMEDETEGVGDSGDEVADVGGLGEDDGGVEGTGDAPEDSIEEKELPELDADDEGNYEGEDLLGELPDLPDDRPPAWDPSPWATLEGAGAAVPCSALAVAGGRVVAGGGVLLLVPPGEQAPRRAGLDVSAASIALTDDAIVVATQRGRVLRSDDGGATASSLGAWRASSSQPVALAVTPGRLWILAEGTLWSLTPGAGAAVRVIPASRESGVVQIAASGSALLALSQVRGAARLERVRGDDEGTAEVPLSGAAQRAASARGAVLALGASGRAVAIAGADVLCVSRDGGATFRAVGGLPPVLALAFAGDAEAAPLLALCARDGEGGAEVAQVPAHGDPTLIAAIGEGRAREKDEGAAPAAMAWDPSREAAWIACHAGLFAIAPKREH